MLKEGANNGVGSFNNRSRVCDACRSAACIVYCHADSAYLCSGCDARVHGANRVASRHERVLVCEACGRAPAAFLCKADAASLCSSCDAEIHSANPIASNHHRTPILPTTEPLHGEEEHGLIGNINNILHKHSLVKLYFNPYRLSSFSTSSLYIKKKSFFNLIVIYCCCIIICWS